EIGIVAPSLPVGGEETDVVADDDGLASDGCGASRSERATSAFRAEDGVAVVGDVDRHLVRTGDGASAVVDGEVVTVELVVAEFRVRCQRPRLDQHSMPAS